MLRFGYLPSDFNPMVLMLGEAEDFRALAGTLRWFARSPAELALNDLDFCRAAKETRIILSCEADASGGLHALSGAEHAFAWKLDPSLALDCAERVEALTSSNDPAGSETLDAGEIPLKLSRGEYTEDFLASCHHATSVR